MERSVQLVRRYTIIPSSPKAFALECTGLLAQMTAMPDTKSPAPRSVDHCVLPVTDLRTARRRLEALGFTVAPDASHPFGTANCCVFFSDNTYLEPIAVIDAGKAQDCARKGQTFNIHNLAYRYRSGEDGFSALVFKTGDADADHAGFLHAGISGGSMVEFARDFADPSGKLDKASFRLAFAADPRSPDSFFFTCQRVLTPRVDRSALERHDNGVTGLKSVILSAPRAADFTESLSTVVKTEPDGTRSGEIVFRAGNAELRVLDDVDFASRFDGQPLRDPGLRLRSILFGVRDVGKLENLLHAAATTYSRHGSTIVVPPTAGQGAFFMFEAE
ncbi:MAG: VOC family protein [Rhizobiaceae bacterium]|nr:MAG: VOC family protein [Rhizobiaceae bacterium]